MRCGILDGAHPLGEFGIVPNALMFDRLDECTYGKEFPRCVICLSKKCHKKRNTLQGVPFFVSE